MSKVNFIDYLKIYACSGKGGKGSAHLHREKYIDKGGPDGGDGGRGGHVIIRSNSNLWTLVHLKFKKHHKAEHGKNGGANRSKGANGRDIYIDVPLGTVVKNLDTQEVVFELTKNGEEHILRKGGKGGKGNWHFKSPTNQTPRYAQPGTPQEYGWYSLELKLLADVGLVGFPNAGKSTLLSTITCAKPKIGDYPFTTLKPNLGIVEYHNFKSFVIADIPGIIQGAAKGKGLGHYFLRHIERNSTLLFLIPVDSDNIKKQYSILLNELNEKNPELLKKKRLLAISKSDLLDQKLKIKIIDDLPKNIDYIFISSVSQIGISELKDKLWNMINNKYN